MTIGSCLLANELEGMGKEMLEMRINGDSWATIAEKFDLPNPSAARAKFTKLTGITDYKAKGHTLQMLANDLSSKASKTGIFEAKKAVKKADKALKLEDDLSGLKDWQKAHLKSVELDQGKGSAKYKQTLDDFKAQNAIKPVQKEVVQAVVKDLPEAKPTKWKSGQQLAEDTGLPPETVGKIIEMNQNGQGYLAIKNQLGIEFKQIDEVVWNSVLKQADGNLWEAYQAKVTSQSGFEAVEKAVWDLKKSGLSVEDIAKMDGMPPKNIVEAIIKGDWKLPPAGSLKPFEPPAPPKPPEVFGVKVDTGYVHPSYHEMDRWISPTADEALPRVQRQAIREYTGSGSTYINDYLRKGSVPDSGFYSSWTSEKLDHTVTSIDKAMRPTPTNMKVTRNTGINAFPTEDLESLVGDVIRDKGFLSTTISPSGVFTHHNVQLIIDVPQGAQARWVQNISAHKSEQEVILARNTPLLIHSVERKAGGRWTIHAEVVV